MAFHQLSTVDTDALIVGNCKIQVATYDSAYTTIASVASAVTDLGAGMISSAKHNIEKFTVQAGNAPDPLEGIASETFTISGELIEFSVAKIASAWGGMVTTATAVTTTKSYLSGGGKSEMTPKTFLLTNTRIVNGASQQTNIVLWKAYMTNGIELTIKSDNDADPISVLPFEVEAILDGTRTAGNQLFMIEKWLD
jgi:hypothetical protein